MVLLPCSCGEEICGLRLSPSPRVVAPGREAGHFSGMMGDSGSGGADEGPFLIPLRFDSSVLSEDQQFAAYASGLVNFEVSRPGNGPFRARALVWRIGKLVISEVESDPIRLDRPAHRIRSDRTDHLYVNYYFRGRFAIECDAGQSRGQPGSLVVIDMRQPCRLDLEHNADISVAIPRHLVLDRLGGLDPHGMVVRGGTARVLGAMLRSLCAVLSRTAPVRAAAIEQMVTDLVVTTLRDAAREAEARAARREALISRVRAYIDQHLAENLDVDRLCAALAVSRSTLYRAFDGEGGIQRQIQARRLRHVQSRLADPAETRPIAHIAATAGFADHSHLTRAFKKAFGMTPGAYRQAAASEPAASAASDEDAARRFTSWIRGLS